MERLKVKIYRKWDAARNTWLISYSYTTGLTVKEESDTTYTIGGDMFHSEVIRSDDYANLKTCLIITSQNFISFIENYQSK